MQKICDLFFTTKINPSHLRFLSIYDKNFVYDSTASYSDFLNVNVKRINLVRFVIELRKDGVKSFSIPVEYRDNKLLSKSEGFQIAKKYAQSQGYDVIENSERINNDIPIYWHFSICNDPEERSGGHVCVDRLDGHIWDLSEYEEYMYDYNAILD